MKAQILPGALHLRDFFFQRHAPEQVINPLLDWKLCVAIRRRLLSETSRTKTEEEENHQPGANRRAGGERSAARVIKISDSKNQKVAGKRAYVTIT